jgi:hypothetical protein
MGPGTLRTITTQRSALLQIVPHHWRRHRRHCDHLVDQQSLADDPAPATQWPGTVVQLAPDVQIADRAVVTR